MGLAVGTRLGPYEILAPIGAGGMGEVYRAKDTKLKREVALKILPEAFASDPERMARFQREAEVLASLNHPNIAQIYGVEERALVMELVDGESPKGPMSFDDAWKIASQIAAGLEYAHEKGIVHRDLKPANIKVTPEGTVKLLDFGLAKAFTGPAAASGSPENSPTLTLGATQLGVILGTAAYMAPEQAKGKTVDKRADIWSFGVVLYELLTGERLFTGDDAAEVLAAVIHKQINLDRVPKPLRRLLLRCLEKDPKERLRDIGEARFLLAEPWAPADAAPSRSHLKPAFAVTTAVLLIALAGVSYLHFREQPPESAVIRFQIPAPDKTNISGAPVISPDGRRVAFVGTGADGASLIWIRSLNSLETHSFPGTELASPIAPPFWSPDSRYLAFYADLKLKKIDTFGGPPQTLCIADGFTAGAWNRDGVIVFGRQAHGLSRILDRGGDPTSIPGPNNTPVSVSFMPDDRHIIYSVASVLPDNSPTVLVTLDGKENKRLISGSSSIVYAPRSKAGEYGHLLYTRENTLMAQPLDENTFDLAGNAFPIAEQVVSFSASANGAIVYRNGRFGGIRQQMVWFDRTGKSLGTVGPPGTYNDLALSPDGTRVALSNGVAGNLDIWIVDITRGAPTRLTFDAAIDWDPVWSPDGTQVAFASQRGGQDQIYAKDSHGIGNEQALWKSPDRQRPKSWSPDGKFLLYMQAGANSGGYNLWILPVGSRRSGEEHRGELYFASSFNITQGQFSPAVNAPHWVAYTSNESGQTQVYVQSFPAGAGKFQLSTTGGVQPRWRPDGKELFYLSMERKLMAVDINIGPKFEYSAPKELFQTPILGGGGFAYVFRYDVTPDGKRFLILSDTGNTSQSPPINVVLNWTAGLRK